jgi:uncharacterized membrane protein (UPF0127 family)
MYPLPEAIARPHAAARGRRRAQREGEGLLFLWPEEEAAWRAFEIAEVDYPIEVVFVGPDGRITAIESLDPGDARTVHGDGETDLAIELPQGWSVGNGVAPGDTVTIEGR